MTAEQARERAKRVLDISVQADPVAELRDAIARELLLAQAEATDEAAKQLRARAARITSDFHRWSRDTLNIQAEHLEAKATELRRAAEGI